MSAQVFLSTIKHMTAAGANPDWGFYEKLKVAEHNGFPGCLVFVFFCRAYEPKLFFFFFFFTGSPAHKHLLTTFLTPATNSQVCPSFLSHQPTVPLSDDRQRPSHWRPCLFTSLKSKNHSWNLEGACKLLLAVRFFPQVGQDPTLSPCKELPNYSVCMVLWAPHQHTLPFGTSYFLLGRIKIIASQMALYGGISLLASTVVQPVCLFASKQTLGELREVNIFAFLIACNAVARGFMKNKLPQEERHLLHYMCSASSHYSSSIQSSLCVCSRRFLEAFFCQGPSSGVCYVHILRIPAAPLCRLKCVLIHSSLWLLYNKII